MNKKIVILTGSPRRGGNCDRLTGSFEEAAQAGGIQTVRYDTARMNIRSCTMCHQCFSAGEPCVYGDDFNRMAGDLRSADGIVLVFPVYCYGMPSQIIAAIDKMYALSRINRSMFEKRSAVISCCAQHRDTVFDGIRKTYQSMADRLQWQSVGELYLTGLWKKEDSLSGDACDKAAALALRFK